MSPQLPSPTQPAPTATAAPYMPKVPAISAWLNCRMNGRSAPAAILRFHRRLYLASQGRLGHGMFGAPCLILSTTGRRTGMPRQVPLVYVRDGANYVLAASNDGQDHDPAWLLNIRTTPAVALLVKRQRVTGTAKILAPTDPGYGRLWAAFNTASGDRYQHYQAKTARPIPLVVIEPALSAADERNSQMASTTPAAGVSRTRPPAAALAAVTIQVLAGTITSVGGVYFGLKAGGGWIASAALFAAAWPLWILSAAGLIRGSARARKIALGLATALLAFSAFKITWIHQSSSYPIAAVDLVLLACLMAPSTRRFTSRQAPAPLAEMATTAP